MVNNSQKERKAVGKALSPALIHGLTHMIKLTLVLERNMLLMGIRFQKSGFSLYQFEFLYMYWIEASSITMLCVMVMK